MDDLRREAEADPEDFHERWADMTTVIADACELANRPGMAMHLHNTSAFVVGNHVNDEELVSLNAALAEASLRTLRTLGTPEREDSI
jgi:hypothetical protein